MNAMNNKECVLLHVPKMNNWYRPFGDTLYIKSMAIGLLAMAEYLQRYGISAEVMHLGSAFIKNHRFDPADYIREKNPLAVGISLHWHYQSYDAVELARYIKSAFPATFVFLGGLTASCFADEIMQDFQFVDGVIKGDGEVPLLRLMQELKAPAPDLGGVPNLLWRDAGLVRANSVTYVADEAMLNSLEYMDFDLLHDYETYINIFGRSTSNYIKLLPKKMNTFRRRDPWVVMPIARGCSANCKWCGGARHAHTLSSGRRRYVFRSPERIIEDMKKALGYGFTLFHFAHYSHPRESDYYLELFRKVREERIPGAAYFECSALPTRELVDAFKETYGKYESSCLCLSRMAPNEEVRRLNVGNFYTNSELYDILSYIDGKGIGFELTFTLGMPGEKEADVAKLRKFRAEILKSFRNIRSGVVLTSQIEPGSLWHLEPARYNIGTERAGFKDFYSFHSQPRTSYFSHLGYWIKGYCDKQKSGVKWFEKKLLKTRCRNFCLLCPRTFGSPANFIGNVKCRVAGALWTVLGLLVRRKPSWHPNA